MSLKRFAKRNIDAGNRMLVGLCSRSGWSSSLYYVLFSRRFDREHHGVLVGRRNYLAGSSPFLLRRGIHRLEKGMIMRPRRDIFGLQYIEDTVETFCALHRQGDADEDLMQWARDVLEQYFEIVGSTPEIDRSRAAFFALNREEMEARDWIPYPRGTEDSPVSYPEFLALSKRRRSVRWFLQKPVERELIDKAVTAAAQAPSACNRQPFEFRIFDEPEAVASVIGIPMGSKGFAQNVPAVAVVVGHLSAFFHERDRHVIYIDASLATMTFLYALESQGLSSCCLNWPDHEPYETQMAERLGLSPDERPIMLVAFGHPDPEGMIPYSAKKGLDELRSYNRP